MTPYEDQAYMHLQFWQLKMQKRPSFANNMSKKVQAKMNDMLPEKVHLLITSAIENLIKAALLGGTYTTAKSPDPDTSLQEREMQVKSQIGIYQKTATVEGAITGAGGILLGLADFPLLIGIKLKLLFTIASIYGYDIQDYKERLYLLYIFQLAFSSQQRRNEIYKLILNWQGYSKSLPDHVEQFNWRTFQQEYRDYIDLAKMAQLLPVVGAAVGAIANYKLIEQLGDTAMNCYRLRRLNPMQILNQV